MEIGEYWSGEGDSIEMDGKLLTRKVNEDSMNGGMSYTESLRGQC